MISKRYYVRYVFFGSMYCFTLFTNHAILVQGLEAIFKYSMPNVNHRYYVRYLHGNFKKKGHIGKTLKDIIWNMARVYKENKHKYHMEKIKVT